MPSSKTKAVVAQHQPVARLADGERGEGVGVDPVEEEGGVRPLHVDLAERGDVDDADRSAHRARLAHIGLLERLAGAAIGARPLPQADIHHLAAGLDVPIVQRRPPERLQMRAARLAGERAEADGVVGRAEAGRADGGDGQAARAGEDREPVQVGGLALVGRHAERRVALQVLDRIRSPPARQADVGRRDVVLEIDEGLALGGDLEERQQAVGAPASCRRAGV